MTYTYLINLGHGEDPTNKLEVEMYLLTLRDRDMLIPGGSLIAGRVDYMSINDSCTDYRPHPNDYMGFPEFFRDDIPEEVQVALFKALYENDEKEHQYGEVEGGTPPRLAYMPTSIHRHQDAWGRLKVCIIAFTEYNAVKAAYDAGFRVKKGVGNGQWRGLKFEEERREKVQE